MSSHNLFGGRFLADTDKIDCENNLYVINELYLINIPSFLFLVGGTVNFCNIRSIGFNRVVKYSDLFKFKLYACSCIILLNTIKVIISIFNSDWWMQNVSQVG